MGAEAMLRLGIEPAAVLRWAARHDPTPLPGGAPIRATRDSIAADLAGADWRAVVARWCSPLLGRLDAHLFHGLIRTAHAARALENHDCPESRGELATGIAAWVGWAERAELVTVQASSDSDSDSDADSLAMIVEYARRGAAAFATRPSIFNLHAVTAPMAYLLLAPHLTSASNALAAGMFARTHQHHPAPPASIYSWIPPSRAQFAELAKRRDAHPAKLVEAALRGLAITGDGAFISAVATMLA